MGHLIKLHWTGVNALNRVLDCVFSFVVLDICTDLKPFRCDVISRGIPDYTVQLNYCISRLPTRARAFPTVLYKEVC